MTRFAAILVLSSSLVSLPAAAGGTPEPVQKLARMAGTWKGKGTVKMGKDTISISGTWTCQQGAGGFGIRCAFAAKGMPGLALYEEMDIMGFDPGDGLVHWYSVTNAGETHDHRGGWQGDTLAVTFTGPKDGLLYTERVEIKLTGNTMRCVSTVYEGAKVSSVFEMTASK
jgi:hypothetical protein